jgi:hypothetical protein
METGHITRHSAGSRQRCGVPTGGLPTYLRCKQATITPPTTAATRLTRSGTAAPAAKPRADNERLWWRADEASRETGVSASAVGERAINRKNAANPNEAGQIIMSSAIGAVPLGVLIVVLAVGIPYWLAHRHMRPQHHPAEMQAYAEATDRSAEKIAAGARPEVIAPRCDAQPGSGELALPQ